jgi:two-component system response regulator AtoC
LRERREDIPLLVDYYAKKYCADLNIAEDPAIDSEMMGLFLQYEWPGNVRELSNTIKRLLVLGDRVSIFQQMSPGKESISIESEPAEEGTDTSSEEIIPLKLLKARASDYIEKEVITYALNIAGGNKVKAAKMLNISYKALFYKMKDLGLR